MASVTQTPTLSPVAGPPPASRAVELQIGGMTCAACAARIEKRLNKIDGVSATVNYATEKATVQAGGELTVEDLIGQVERAGYRAVPVEQRPDGDPESGRVRYLWRRLAVAMLLGVPAGDLAFVMVLVPRMRFEGWQWLLLALSLPVVTWCAWPFHRKAFTGLRYGATSMDTLVSIGIIAASGWSLYTIFAHGSADPSGGGWGALFTPGGSVYLEVAAGVTIFVLGGRLFEAKAKHTAGGALRALAELGAKDVAVLEDGGTEQRIDVRMLRVGDRFVVRPGEIVATDGVVVEGGSAVDTSAMTGEATPIEVMVGDEVIGGTVVLAGRLVVRADRVGADTQLAQLVRLVERAQQDKAGIQRLADRISAVFVPVVVVLALLTLIGWLLAGGTAEHAISAGLAVLIIACPCALGLATPTALLVASGRGAQLGVFIKGHQALESARAVDTVVLDKTGTVTLGRMTVVAVHPAPGRTRAELLRAAGAVEDASEHLVGRAIAALARAELGSLPMVTGFTALAGLGAGGAVEGRAVLVGSTRLAADADVIVPAELAAERNAEQEQGRTTVTVAVDGTAIGVLSLADVVKPGAAEAIAQLHRLGLATVLLTGDNAVTARAVAAEIGVAEVIAEVMPADKEATIARLQADGRVVAMVGDGINDAPALARADLGLAVVTGTDIALGASDIILVREELDVVPTAVRLARATLSTIRGNFVWAFGYNIAAIPIAAAGLLNPLIAAAAMAVSSLFVVTNSLRLRKLSPSR
ncbi:Cu+-exporting ATPase [Nocardia sp. GAS34]|uniref:heavy metal translocating P-type ATPase n=1 Tax=unclassified Nocardia TaxID=2637762 RepID=UPI003D1B2B63